MFQSVVYRFLQYNDVQMQQQQKKMYQQQLNWNFYFYRGSIMIQMTSVKENLKTFLQMRLHESVLRSWFYLLINKKNNKNWSKRKSFSVNYRTHKFIVIVTKEKITSVVLKHIKNEENGKLNDKIMSYMLKFCLLWRENKKLQEKQDDLIIIIIICSYFVPF